MKKARFVTTALLVLAGLAGGVGAAAATGAGDVLERAGNTSVAENGHVRPLVVTPDDSAWS
ncbi:hypothetical protein [Streptomyces sp. NBC_00620]|uniref:hypothetical protein n=1 Tax=Streptomyces sp. NBC_00620 TaxID=2903666 RepID=UPI0022562A9E|nr:hypothetical protein [Streptomyces sp. NBC_00620]MCX4972729.1 hypothetical protein [Streptomyces sp. NBC_00620]